MTLPGAGGTADTDAAARWLAARRWSGARGGALRVLGPGPVARLFDTPAASLHVWRVSVNDGPPYDLLDLLVRRRSDAPPAAGAERFADDGVEALYDGVADPEVRLALLDAMRGARRFASADVTARPVDGASPPPVRASRVGTAEQSNTSLLYDDAVIVKLFRRVEVGVNPDVEIGGFLTRRAFAHVPPLYGTATLRVDGGEAVVAMAQALVPNAEDAWAYATRAAAASARGEEDPGAYASEAARLGMVTRALHDALASAPDDPDFAPEPAGRDDVALWRANTERAYGAMREAATTLVGGGDPYSYALELGDDARLLAPAAAAARAVGDDAGMRIRHHGDYHLGQVLRGADGALHVIDFEGEPAKPLAERRRKHSALRDVAGMVRSFGYAAAFAAKQELPGARSPADVAERADAWEAAARRAFLDGYFTAPGNGGAAPGGGGAAPYLPATRSAADALLRLFELEKLYYEVRYELLNRPDWVGIPLGALARVMVDGADDAGGR